MRVAAIMAVWRDPTLSGILRDMHARFKAQGDDLFVIARKDTPDAPPLSFENGLLVHQVGWVPPHPGLARAASLCNLLWVPWQTSRILRRERHDLVHYHFSGTDWSLLSLILPWLRRGLFVTFHGCLRGTRRPIFRWMCRKLVRRASKVSAVSAELAEVVKLHYPAAGPKIAVIHNGIDLEVFRPSAGPARAWPRPYIASVARQAAYKGLDLLVFAFAGLLKRGVDLDLLICGPEDDGGRLRRLVDLLKLADRVHFLGTIPKREVLGLLSGARFVVQASREESGLSLACLEALAAGKPLIATAIPENISWLTHERDSLLIPPRNVDALERGMLCLLEDAALESRLGAGAVRTAGAFGADKMCVRYLEWYGPAGAVSGSHRGRS